MEHQKVLNLLNETNDSQLVTRNGTLSMIVQRQIAIKQMKLPIIQTF